MPRIHPFQVRLGGRIALVVEAVTAGRKLVTYNLHLESRGPDAVQLDQLEETLSDASQYDLQTALVLAGDLSLEASKPDAAGLIQRAGFRNTEGLVRRPIIHGSCSCKGGMIDWAFIRGPVEAKDTNVDSSVRASDHYPLLFVIHSGLLTARQKPASRILLGTRVASTEAGARWLRCTSG